MRLGAASVTCRALVRGPVSPDGMGAGEPGCVFSTDERGGVVQRDAVLRIGQIFGREPPRHRVVLHAFQDEAGRERRGVALHHLVVKAADRLHLPERERDRPGRSP